jgi:16S rRNA (cytidine1402-2'-O)-methyltransferase
MVFYESPYRVKKFLGELIEHLGPERRVSVSREITKLYEETIRGEAHEVLSHFENKDPRGEFVIVVAGKAD